MFDPGVNGQVATPVIQFECVPGGDVNWQLFAPAEHDWTPPTDCTTTNTCPPPPAGVHTFQPSVITDLKRTTDLQCLTPTGAFGLASCQFFDPALTNGGWYLRAVEDLDQCLGPIKPGSTLVGLVNCSTDTIWDDQPIQTDGLRFPLKNIATGFCLGGSSTAELTSCTPTPMYWFDSGPSGYTGPRKPNPCSGYSVKQTALTGGRPARTDLAAYQYFSSTASAGLSAKKAAVTIIGLSAGASAGMFIATPLLSRYLDASGQGITLSQFQWNRLLDQGGIGAIVNDIAKANSASIQPNSGFSSSIIPLNRESKSGDPSGQMTTFPGWFRIISPDNAPSDYPGSRLWLLPNDLARGLGSFDLRIQGSKLANNAVCFKIFVTDRYEFEPTGLDTGIPGINDNDMAEMHKSGIAQNYDITGGYERTCMVQSVKAGLICPGSGSYIYG
jgi:hypothetical protein